VNVAAPVTVGGNAISVLGDADSTNATTTAPTGHLRRRRPTAPRHDAGLDRHHSAARRPGRPPTDGTLGGNAVASSATPRRRGRPGGTTGNPGNPGTPDGTRRQPRRNLGGNAVGTPRRHRQAPAWWPAARWRRATTGGINLLPRLACWLAALALGVMLTARRRSRTE
jgi:hypothetical protein